MPEEIMFKAEYRIDHFPFEEGPAMTLSCRTESNKDVLLAFRHPTQSEVQEGYKRNEPVCTVSASRNGNSDISAIFESLRRREVPEGSTHDGWEDFLDDNDRIRLDRIIGLRMLPPRLQEFVKQIETEFHEAVTRAVGLLRWYGGIAGPHSPTRRRQGGLFWSLDGSSWELLSSYNPVTSLEIRCAPGQAEFDEVQQLLNAGITEPFCHGLFREAWEQKSANPRSALLLGIASAEIGFKEFVAKVVPDAEWLVENIPSPPLVKMLEEYLPILRASVGAGAVSVPAPDILALLREGVQLRNKVAHYSSRKIDSKKLLDILYAVLDVLILLDHYRGFDFSQTYAPRSST